MKNKIQILVALMFCFINVFAQKQANIWYFGDVVGLDFNTNPPTTLTNGAMYDFEGCSSIADDNGSLLFYTDGSQVWNKNHQVMSNGNGLGGNSSSTQSALIVKQPGNLNIYYLFTTDAFNGSNGFQYNVIDMNLNSGLGDVTLKNQNIYSPSTERLSACTHSNNTDIWIMTHQTNSNNFVAYQLNSSGLILTPVISSCGPKFTGSNLDFIGYLKFSPHADRIAMAESSPSNFWLFDFNASTGVVSNVMQLISPISIEGAYGVEFSPNGKVLYGTVELTNNLFQWDITSGDSAIINASRIDLNPQLLGASYAGSLALATNGKIYFTRNACEWLGVINNPNVIGTGCNYVDSGIYLQGQKCYYGLPNLNQSLYRPGFHFDNVCYGDSTNFSLGDTTGVLNVQWNFGDPTSGINNTSSSFNPKHLFTGNGVYNVSLLKYYATLTDTITSTVTINNFPIVNLGSDTTLCAGETILLKADSCYSYYWSNNSYASTMLVSAIGTYWVIVSNGSCSDSDSINIIQGVCFPIGSFSVSDSLLCGPHCIDFFDESKRNPTSWQWYFPGGSPSASNQKNPTNICYNVNGNYDVVLIACNQYGCDTLTYLSRITEFTPTDSLVIMTDTIWSQPFATYQWFQSPTGLIPGATGQYFVAPATGAYFCIATDSDGCATTSNTVIAVVLKGSYTILPGQENQTFQLYLNDELLLANAKLQIVDAIGRLIYKTDLSQSKSDIVLNVSGGIYFFVVESDAGNYVSKIFVK